MNHLSATCLYLVVIATPVLACAQQKARPDPADPKISVPPVVYVSPLQQYRPLGDEQVAPWKAANEVVEKAGGWKIYAKETQEPKPGTGPAVTPAPQPTPQSKTTVHDGHAGHKKN